MLHPKLQDRLPPVLAERGTDAMLGFLEALDEGLVYVLDTETDGLDGRVWMVGLQQVREDSSPELFVMAGEGDPTCAMAKARKRITNLIQEGAWFVLHNAKYDVAVLSRYLALDIPWDVVVDTQVMAWCYAPHLPSHSLDALSGAKLDLRQACLDAGLVRAGDKHEAVYHLPPWGAAGPILNRYLVQDLSATMVVLNKAMTKLSADPLAWSHYWAIERPFTQVVHDMETRGGFFLNLQAAQALVQEYQEQIDALSQEAQSMVGLVPKHTTTWEGENTQVKTKTYARGKFTRNGVTYFEHCEVVPFNPSSLAHKRFALARQGWTTTETTETGAPKLDSAVLSALEDKYPVAALLSRIAKLAKYKGLVAGYLERAEPAGGDDECGLVYLRGQFNQTQARTGRLSSSQPNLQNIPSRGEHGERIRSLFVVPSDEWVMVGCDCANIEARIIAHYMSHICGDSRLCDAFAQGLDFHQANADAWGLDRTTAKTVLFATAYGAGVTKLGGGDKDKGQAIVDSLRKNCPALLDIKERFWKMLRANHGVAHSWLGRRLTYLNINSKDKALRAQDERGSFNALIQGTAADVFKCVMLCLREDPKYTELNPHLCALVHDEAQWYFRGGLTPEQLEAIIKPHFRYNYNMSVPLNGDVKLGHSWTDTH